MTIKNLADIAKKRLRGPDHSMLGDRRLVTMPRDTRRKLAAIAVQLRPQLGFHVYPMQVAALIIDSAVKDIET